jgi:hypothetical protein
VVGLGVATLPRGGGDETASVTSGAAQDSGDSAAEEPERAAAGLVTNDSGRDYAAPPDTLATALPAVLSGTAGAAPAAAAAPQQESAPSTEQFSTGDSLDRLREPAALDSCLTALLPPDDASVRPLALDYAAYGGQPALVVVLSAGDPAKVDVFVVGADCAQGDDRTLFFTRLDRP